MYVIFDMDGVILDSERLYARACDHACQVLDLPVDLMRETMVRCTGVTWDVEEKIVREAFAHIPHFSYEEMLEVVGDYFNDAVEKGQLVQKPGAEELLIWLKDQEIKTGLASSTGMDTIKKELEGLNVLSLFDVIVSGDMVTHSKPDPEIFLMCAEKMGISPEDYADTYVVEDSYNGIRAAYEAGMMPVMVPDRLEPTDEMREKACMILPSLPEFMSYLRVSRGLPYIQ